MIEDCQFIEPRHLGFSRKIAIVDGPMVQEHVLVDLESDSVIFIEEFVVTPDGERHPGAFAALNQVVEEDGQWYFSGIYLYDEPPPTDEEIQAREEMFKATYENMLTFIECNDVDEAFNNLKDY